MRTNVEIDDEVLRQATKASGKSTKKEVVEEALRLVVQLKKQEGILKLFGKVHWEGDLDEMRASRFPEWDDSRNEKQEVADTPAAQQDSPKIESRGTAW
jgi:Arc/MetJ family transcription regulator